MNTVAEKQLNTARFTSTMANNAVGEIASVSDAQLVTAVLNGDTNAYAQLVGRYERSVRAVALSVLADSHLAEDAAQEAFVRMYKKLSKLKNANAFGPWLLKITKRCSLDIAARRKKIFLTDSPAEKETLDVGIKLDEEKEELLNAIAKLPASQQQVVMLRYFENNGVRQVARLSGRSVGTVTKQLSRAHKKLCLLIGDRNGK